MDDFGAPMDPTTVMGRRMSRQGDGRSGAK